MLRRLFLMLACGLLLWPSASAHLMVAQKGTLNLSGTGAYLMVSIPVSALQGVDDDQDGLLSAPELQAHESSITRQLKAGLQLSDAGGARPLEILSLTLSPKHTGVEEPADQLVVAGRYALADKTNPLTFQAKLFGTAEAERSLNLTVTKAYNQPRLLILTPAQPSAGLYVPALSMFARYLTLGLEHVLGGLDHLLFLLVVLSAGWGWKRLFAALSLFTVGHALSLAAVVFAGLSAPAAVVEPAIAATIVGLALYDRWAVRQRNPMLGLRLTLVFGCSLIHGLGLGGALAELGLDPSRQGLSMLGFNLGIEAAQIGVSLVALAVLAGVRALFGVRGIRTAGVLASVAAIVVGSVWFAQRVLLAA